MRRHKHNLSHFRNTTMNMGQLTPIGCTEVVHGDTFKHNTNMFMRVSPLAYPVMHPVHTHIHHVFVPLRLLWDKWEDFITGGEEFDDASVVPTITFDGEGDNPDPVEAGDLANQLGLPVGFSGTANAFPFRAYNLIYNELIRDEQLQAEVDISLDSGPDTTTSIDLLNANWSKDYFTSSRPDDQLGPDVTLPLGASAPIATDAPVGNAVSVITNSDGSQLNTLAAGATYVTATDNNATPGTDLYADLSQAEGATINAFRLAIATQQWQEIINHTGNSYQDYLRRYGIKYSDARLQLPEHLASGKQTVQFSEVIQTGPGSADEGVGNLRGHGIAAMRSNSYVKFFEEPGLVISLLHVKPIPMYMQALHKMWSRSTKEDFYQKEFEILGMQEVLNKEVLHSHTSPDATFGYQKRFQDYRFVPNTVHGEFATLLKDYHLAREFDGDVALNSSFITCEPTDRIFQSTDTAQLQVTVQHKLAARRIISKYHKSSGLKI